MKSNPSPTTTFSLEEKGKFNNYIPLLVTAVVLAIVVNAVLSWIPTSLPEAVKQYYTSASYVSSDGALMISLEEFDDIEMNELFFKKGFSD